MYDRKRINEINSLHFSFCQTEPYHTVKPTLSPNLRLFSRELELESMLLMLVHLAQTTGTRALDGHQVLSSRRIGYPLHELTQVYP
jgi:hypothetical protein